MLLQLFGCVDWAPSDLITAFLLAGAAQSARRRVQVAAIMAAGGPGSAPSSERKASGPLPHSSPVCTLCRMPSQISEFGGLPRPISYASGPSPNLAHKGSELSLG